jgi:hypothetical protein
MYEIYFDQFSAPVLIDADDILEVLPGSYSFIKMEGYEKDGGKLMALIPKDRVCMILKAK